MSPDANRTETQDEYDRLLAAEQNIDENRSSASPYREASSGSPSPTEGRRGPRRALFVPNEHNSGRVSHASPRSQHDELQHKQSCVSERILQLLHPSTYVEPYEAEQDLREFLRVVKPDWSAYRPKGYCEIDRVMAKLKGIGVVDIWELMHRVETNTINENLFHAGHSCFSEHTLELIRHQRQFLCALEHLREPYYRQVGLFAPVPQLLAKSNRWCRDNKVVTAKGQGVGGLVSRCGSSAGSSRPRPSTAPDASGHAKDARPRRVSSAAGPRRVSSAVAKSRSNSATTVDWCSEQSSEQNIDLLSNWSGPRPTSRQQLRFSHPCVPPRSCWSGAPALTRSTSLPRKTRLDTDESGKEASDSLLPRRMSSGALNLQMQSAGHLDRVPETRRTAKRSDGDVSRQVSSDASEEVTDAVLHEIVEKMHNEGAMMATQSRTAQWNNLTSDTLLDHGEAVLAEQHALEDKSKLYHAMSREGSLSATRKVISANIQCRLREEAARDAKSLLEVHHQCTSIRRNLNAMANARRDLNGVRMHAQKLLEEEKKEEMYNCLRSRIHTSLIKHRAL